MTCSNRKLQRMHSVVEGKEALQVCVVLIVRNYCGVVDVGLGTMATWIGHRNLAVFVNLKINEFPK